jgi:hypothetical protein
MGIAGGGMKGIIVLHLAWKGTKLRVHAISLIQANAMFRTVSIQKLSQNRLRGFIRRGLMRSRKELAAPGQV